MTIHSWKEPATVTFVAGATGTAGGCSGGAAIEIANAVL